MTTATRKRIPAWVLLPLALVVMLLASRAMAQSTTEVLIGTSATSIGTALAGRTGVELQNLGPNPIYCAIGTASTAAAAAVSTKARRLDASGGLWALNADSRVKIYCICSVAQSTGAALIVSQGK